MPDPIAWAIVGIVGALLAMDRTAAFQTMISRPITAGPIIGLVLGHPATGVFLGAFFELLWMGRLPLGGHLPPNASLAAVVTTAAVILSAPAAKSIDHDLIVFGFLFGPPLARISSALERRLREQNSRFLQLAMDDLENNRIGGIPRRHQAALRLNLVSTFIFVLVCVPIIQFLISLLYPVMPQSVHMALGSLFYFIPLIGIAAALGSINIQRNYLFFSICFIVALLLLLI